MQVTARSAVMGGSCSSSKNAPDVATRDDALVVKAAGLAAGKGVMVCDEPSKGLLALEAIMKDRPQDLETGVRPDLQTGSADQVGLLTGEFKGRAYIPCPHCSKLMTPQNYAKYSGVIVDLCKDHGIWFDAGELNRILDFVSRGGLVKARKKEAERAKDEARAARIDAQTASLQTRASAHSAAGYPVQSTPGQGLFLEAVEEGLFGLFKK